MKAQVPVVEQVAVKGGVAVGLDFGGLPFGAFLLPFLLGLLGALQRGGAGGARDAALRPPLHVRPLQLCGGGREGIYRSSTPVSLRT
eukprot:420151-Prorocentrum_minimum.AAC.1